MENISITYITKRSLYLEEVGHAKMGSGTDASLRPLIARRLDVRSGAGFETLGKNLPKATLVFVGWSGNGDAIQESPYRLQELVVDMPHLIEEEKTYKDESHTLYGQSIEEE